MASLGRHDQPENQGCTSPWWNRPVSCYIRENSMKQKPKASKGKAKSEATLPKEDKGVSSKPMSKPKTRGRRNSQSKPSTGSFRPEQPEIPETVSGGGLSKRVSPPFAINYSVAYPQHVDLVTYSVAFTPAGDVTGSNSLTGAYFLASKGPKFLIDVQNAYRRTPVLAFTIAQLQEYINTVTAAYSYLVATREHVRHLYWSTGRQNLNERLALIYDDTIRNSHMLLASELSSHFLPPKVINLVDKLYSVYSIDTAYDVPDFQLTPWTDGYNNAAAFVAGYTTLIAALRAIPNLDALRSSFISNWYANATVPMQILDFGADYINPDKFLEPAAGAPKYDVDMLNVWANLPMVAYATSLAVFPVATVDAAVPLVFFGAGVTEVQTSFTTKMCTTTGRTEPGLINPAKVVTVNGDNNFKYIDAAGLELEVDIRTGTMDATILGILARNAENVHCVDAPLLQVVPSGAGFSTTSLRNLSYDANETMDVILS